MVRAHGPAAAAASAECASWSRLRTDTSISGLRPCIYRAEPFGCREDVPSLGVQGFQERGSRLDTRVTQCGRRVPPVPHQARVEPPGHRMHGLALRAARVQPRLRLLGVAVALAPHLEADRQHPQEQRPRLPLAELQVEADALWVERSTPTQSSGTHARAPCTGHPSRHASHAPGCSGYPRPPYATYRTPPGSPQWLFATAPPTRWHPTPLRGVVSGLLSVKIHSRYDECGLYNQTPL
jgi:hypothetical protein